MSSPIFLACNIRSSMVASDASVRAFFSSSAVLTSTTTGDQRTTAWSTTIFAQELQPGSKGGQTAGRVDSNSAQAVTPLDLLLLQSRRALNSNSKVDAETLRTILETQTKAQQQMFTELMKRMEKMASASHPAVLAAPVATAEFDTNSLSTRLPEFVYDPKNGCTFEVWYNRYEDLISKDGATLDDAAKARLIVSKLDVVTYARFTNHILPKRACDVPLTDTVAVLKELFGHNMSVFAKRYAYLKTQRSEESLRDYTGLVNLCYAMAEFNDVTLEQMKCLVWICGLVDAQDTDVRARGPSQNGGQPLNHVKGACCRSPALSRHSSGCHTPRTIKCTACQRRGFAKESKS
ncbi:hypothetical protein RB195_023602 [Necator americanus]|uniref:DUF7083 domain-containing protein n=1 Tax=Necator americanus TaxID=51031 RepID=A0ABR1EJY3_NECAM